MQSCLQRPWARSRPPAPCWHPGAHPLPRPVSQPGKVAPSAEHGENHIPGWSTAAPSSALPGTHPAQHRVKERESSGDSRGRSGTFPGFAGERCAAGPSRPVRPHKAELRPRAGGAQGVGKHLLPRCLQTTACSAAPERARHGTFARLRLRGTDAHLPKALRPGRQRAGSTPEKLPQHTLIPLFQEPAPLERNSGRDQFLPPTDQPA